MKRIFTLFYTCLFILISAQAAAPTTQATNIAVTNRGVTQLDISWTSGDGANRIVVVKAGAGPVDNPVNGTDYTPGAFGTGGAQIGATGSYVVAEVVGAGTTATITGLSAATTYTIKVFEYNGTGATTEYNVSDAAGNPLTTFTLSAEPTAQPTGLNFTSKLETGLGYTVSYSTATGTPTGYLVLVRSGLVASSGTPVDGTTYTAGASIGDGTVAFVDGAAALTFNETALLPATSFTYTVFSFNGSGGNINYYLTSPLTGTTTTLSAQASTQASDIVFSSPTTTSLTLNWTNGNGSERLVLAKSGGAVDVNPSDGTAYTGNANFGSATDIGSGNRVVFRGAGNSVAVTGLSANTVYHFKVFELNGSASNSNYLTTDGASGNPLSRTTLTNEPTGQPSGFSSSSITASSYTVTFAAASGPPAGYLAIRRVGASPTGTPTDGQTYSVGDPIGDGVVAYIGATPTFGETGLAAVTTYHYDIFSFNGSAGSTNYRTSSPLQGSVATICAAPATQANSVNFTSVQAGSLTVNWTRGDGDNVIVVGRQGTATSVTPLSGTTYTANASFGAGTALAVTGNDYFVVYSGSGTSVAVTDLSSNSTYNFKVFEFNNTNTCYNTAETASNGLTTPSASSNSTISAGGGVATIPSTVDTNGEKVNSFTFTVTDAGDDGADTDISSIIIRPGTGNDVADWTQIIAGVELTDNAGNGPEDYSSAVVGTNTITITGINNSGQLGDTNDGQSKVYTLKVWLLSSLGGSLPSTVDGLNLAFSIDEADIVTDVVDSDFAPGQSTESGAANNQITVAATQININQQPSTTATATVALAQQPIFEATDVNGNRDLDFNNALVVNTNNPNNLGPASAPGTFSSGVANFTASGFNFGNVGTSTMSVTANAITSPNSSSITVSAATTLGGGAIGMATGPNLSNSATNQAVLGFSLQTTGSALNLTALTITATSDPDVVFNNIRLISSTDNDFATSGDNTDHGAVINTPGNTITLGTFGTPATLSGVARYFFIVADVNSSYSVSNPTITLSLTTANVSVSVGSAVGTTQTGTAYTFLDTTPPTIVSITNQVNPIFESALTQTVVVRFSESMNSSGTFNPSISLTGSNWGAQAAGSWSTTTFVNDTYTTTFTHNATQETIPAAVATISTNTSRDLAGNVITNAPQSSASFVVDNQKPTAVVTTSPSQITTNNLSALQVQVVYSETMNTGMNPTILLSSGAFNPIPSGVWSTTTFLNDTYTVSGITHDGTSQTIASVTATASAGQDARGNVQVTSPASNAFAIDTQRPTVLSVNRQNPTAATPINNTSVVYRVTFSESVTGIAGSDFSQILSGITSGSIVVNPISGSVYDVTIGSISGDGTLGLDVLNTATIADLAGNAYNANFTSGQVYTIDNTPPLLSATSPSNNQFNIQLDANLSITLNENIQQGTGTIQLFKSGGILVESYTAGVSPELSISGGTLTINPSLAGNGGLLEQGTNYYLLISATSITDIAGNQFAGFSITTDWTFTTFAPPTITTVAPLSAGAAVCIGSDVVITGNFLTGVTEVRFNGAGGLLGTNLNLISDTELRARAPLNAQPGPIYIRKAPVGSNPDVNTTSAQSVLTGPSSAVLAVGTINNPNVCTSGTIITSTIKITVTGGTSPYDATYRVTPGALPPVNNLQPLYISGSDIVVDPPGTNVSNLYTIFSVRDANNCPIPDGSGSIPDQRSGSYAVFENQRPVVDAGGPITPPFSYCLANGNNIALNGATLGTAPSMSGASGVTWTRNGSGTFSNANILQPTYTISAFDILNNNLELTISTTGNPGVCDAAVDVLAINFVSNSTADPGGSGGELNFCWDGTPNPIVPLSGSLGGGATGYSWNSISGANTQFSNTTISNPTYQFNNTEVTNGFADIELTPTGGTCGGPGAASPLKIRLQPLPINAFISPKVSVCVGETVTYKVTNTSGNTYNWTVPTTGGTTFEDNGNQINVTWGTTTGPYQISVIETRGTDGCQSLPITVNINLNEEPEPVFSSPNARIFGNQADPVQLVGSGDINNGITNFSGPGVFVNGANQWFFSPSNAGVGSNYPIRYTYTSNTTGCSNFKEELFTVFDGDESIVLHPSGDNLPDFCADEDQVEIKLNPAIAALMPADGFIFVFVPPFSFVIKFVTYQFVGFNGLGIVSNTPGVDPRNADGTAIFDPKLVPTGGITTNVDIVYSYQEFIDGIPNGTPREFGRQTITINPVPSLTPNFASVQSTLCSNSPAINLTKNNTNNPGNNFTFFVSPTTDALYPGIITGDPIAGFVLNPSAYNSLSFDAADIDVFYGYEDSNGCNDTTSVAAGNSLRIALTAQPPAPTIDIGNNICITDGSVPIATITNVVSNSVANANTRWFNNISLNPPTLSQNPDFLAPINPAINNTFDFFAIQEINGCVSPTTQLDYEVLNVPQFTWDKFCVDGTATTFGVNLGSVNATDLTWSILKSDLSTETSQSFPGPLTGPQTFQYNFTASDRYDVTANVTSINGCVASRVQPVILLDKFTATDAQIYSEDFEGGSGGFISLKDDASVANSSWEYGVIDKATIKNPTDNPSNKGWVTKLNGSYSNGERSYLYSGCLDISGLQRPMISFSSWTNTDDKNDGVILQFSVDNKVINDPAKDWNAVGDIGTGFDWYNRQLIQSIPGSKATQNYGWSGDFDKGWKSSKHSLDPVATALQNAGSNNVVFRFAFASTNPQTPKTFDGFAIDSVFIGNRTRTILLENFTNKGNISNSNLEVNQSNTLKGFNPGGIGTRLVKVNYHVGFPNTDPFNLDNISDPSARALYYNVTNTPSARLDGEKPAGAEQPFSQWGQQEYNLRTLQLGQSEILITPVTNIDGSLSITIEVTPNANLPQGTRLHVAILEENINIGDLPANRQSLIQTGETSFEYVLKKMLPNAPGLDTGPLDPNTTYSFGPFTWFPEPTTLYGQPNDLAIVAFLQNESSKEVYQAEIVTDIADPPVVTGLDKILDDTLIKVYPNPADHEITVALPSPALTRMRVQLASQLGVISKESAFEPGEQTKSIDTKELAAGIYILQLGDGKDIVRKKVMVVHK